MSRLVSVLAVACAAHAATLVQLSMDQMTQNATAIVRARVVGSSASLVSNAGSSTIYTHYQLAVTEVWKGAAPAEVMLPGGDLGKQKQSFPGVPELRIGSEYILFLWKSPSTGIVHTIGLTQGIFDVALQPDGSIQANRRATGELLLDSTGRRVTDQPVSMNLAVLKARVRAGGQVQ